MTGQFLRYSALRLLLLAAVLAALALAGARGVVLILLAAIVSMALSYLLLRRQRDAMAAAIAAQVEARRREADGQPGGLGRRFREGLAADAAAEDAEIAASALSGEPTSRPAPDPSSGAPSAPSAPSSDVPSGPAAAAGPPGASEPEHAPPGIRRGQADPGAG